MDMEKGGNISGTHQSVAAHDNSLLSLSDSLHPFLFPSPLSLSRFFLSLSFSLFPSLRNTRTLSFTFDPVANRVELMSPAIVSICAPNQPCEIKINRFANYVQSIWIKSINDLSTVVFYSFLVINFTL